ncbi:MAG: amino acid transport protein [Nitrospirae bacterium]|nr:amino acid transport protein [Nitrospirota bacterium]
MDFDVINLFLIVGFSAAGMGYLAYGKRQQNGIVLAAGLLMMVYPYFISGTVGIIAVGLLLMAAPFIAKRMGW